MSVYLRALHGVDGTDVDAVHRYVTTLFPEGATRTKANILWRGQPEGILVQSTQGFDGAREFSSVFTPGERIRFSCIVNPVVRCRSRERATDAVSWFERKTRGVLRELNVHVSGQRRAERRGGHLHMVALDGEGTVADDEALTHLVRTGVGRAKTFGCGLLITAHST